MKAPDVYARNKADIPKTGVNNSNAKYYHGNMAELASLQNDSMYCCAKIFWKTLTMLETSESGRVQDTVFFLFDLETLLNFGISQIQSRFKLKPGH